MHTLLTDSSLNSSNAPSTKGSRRKWFEILADSNDNSGFDNIDEEHEKFDDSQSMLASKKINQSSVLSEGPLKNSFDHPSSSSSSTSSREFKKNSLQVSVAKTNLFDKQNGVNQAITRVKLLKNDVDMDKFNVKQIEMQKTIKSVSPVLVKSLERENLDLFKKPWDVKTLQERSLVENSDLITDFVSSRDLKPGISKIGNFYYPKG
jgi:hypothetical protein